jgi:hypothetical protein
MADELEPDDKLRMMMAFMRDHPKIGDYETKQILDEINEEAGHLHYKPSIKKLVYHSPGEAMQAYNYLQFAEIRNEIWLAGKREGREITPHEENDIGLEWVARHASEWSHHWRCTHTRI